MLATAALTTVGASLPLFKEISNSIKQKWNNYSEKDMGEIQSIQKYYRANCHPIEKDYKPTTLGIDIASQSDQIFSSELPIYLQMDKKNPKIPVLFAQNFCPNSTVADWTCLLGKNTHLRHSIEEMISYICQYQQDRDKRWFGKGYNYDPTNLFFEEFKSWLVELSKSPLVQETLKVVEARKLYLENLYISQVFEQGKDTPTRADVVQKLLKLLEISIIPIIKLALSRTSAREHFDLLKSNVENLIKNATPFLFYIFRDNEEIPLTFILDQLRNPTLINSYKTCLDSLSGQLLSFLVNSEPFSIVFPRLEFSTELVEYNYQRVMENDFVRQDGMVLFPINDMIFPLLKNKNVHRLNWFKDQEIKFKSGILAKFRQQELMDNFLKLHGLLQKACAFYVICDLLYELAGDGGNLMVYGLAAHKVLDAAKVFNVLVNQIEQIAKDIYQHARNHFDYLVSISSKQKLLAEDNNWKACFDLAHKFHKNLESRIIDCKMNIKDIETAIALVQNPEYIRSVKNRITLFYQLVDDFSNEAFLKDNQPVIPNTKPFELSQAKEKKIGVSPNSENNFGEDYELGIQKYKDGNYQAAFEKFVSACEFNQENMLARLYLAYSYAHCGYLEQAIKMTEIVISEFLKKQQTNDVLCQDALYAQSVFYKNAGLNQARTGLSKLLEINPTHNLAKQELTRIRVIQAENQATGHIPNK